MTNSPDIPSTVPPKMPEWIESSLDARLDEYPGGFPAHTHEGTAMGQPPQVKLPTYPPLIEGALNRQSREASKTRSKVQRGLSRLFRSGIANITSWKTGKSTPVQTYPSAENDGSPDQATEVTELPPFAPLPEVEPSVEQISADLQHEDAAETAEPIVATPPNEDVEEARRRAAEAYAKATTPTPPAPTPTPQPAAPSAGQAPASVSPSPAVKGESLRSIWQRRTELVDEIADGLEDGARYFRSKVKLPTIKLPTITRRGSVRRNRSRGGAAGTMKKQKVADNLYVFANKPRVGNKTYMGNVAKSIVSTQGNIKDGSVQSYDPLKSWTSVHMERKRGIPIDPTKAAKQAQDGAYASRHQPKYVWDAMDGRKPNPDLNSSSNVLDYQTARRLGDIGHKVNEAKIKLQDLEARYKGLDLHDKDAVKDFKKNNRQTFLEGQELLRAAKQARKLKRVVDRNNKVLGSV